MTGDSACSVPDTQERGTKLNEVKVHFCRWGRTRGLNILSGGKEQRINGVIRAYVAKDA